MGFQAGDLEAVRQDLQQIHTQIDNLHMDEQRTQEFAAMQEEIRRQMSLDNGSFAPKNEQEFLALTKVKLEQDIEEITKLIQKENGEVAVTQSARQVQEPVPAQREEQPGVMAKVSGFFRNLFKKEEPPFPRLSKRQREAKLKLEEKKDRKYNPGRMAHPAEVMEIQMHGINPAAGESRILRENFDDYWNLYEQNRWKEIKTDLEKENDPVVRRRQLQSFFRELGNGNCFDHVEDGKFDLDVAEFSKEDILFTLAHPNEEGVQRIIKPLMEFNMEKTMKAYKIHALKSTEQKAAMIRKFYEEQHLLLACSQWAEKFGEDKMSPEFYKKYIYKITQFNLLTGYIMDLTIPSDEHSAEEYYDSVKEHMASLEARVEHAEEFKGIASDVKGKEQLFEEAKGAPELVKELQDAKLVTAEGRPRLIGEEPVDVLLRYGEEDLTYYKKMADIGSWLNHVGAAYVQSLPQAEAAEIKQLAREFDALYSTLSGIFEKPEGTTKCLARMMLRKGFSDPLDLMRKQFSQMDEQ